MRVAVVGSGIAGLAAANALVGRPIGGDRGDVHVTMLEAARRVGGHVYTVEAQGHSIDMGFIVCNRERYPNFCGLLDELGIATRPTTMSFSVRDTSAREWGSASLDAMFAQRRRILDPRHWKFLVEVVGFLRTARQDLAFWRLENASLDDYLAERRVPREVRDRFVVPLAAALWSLAPDHCGAFPALTYLRFLEQHGMLSPVRALHWHTVVGGSSRYVDALLARLRVTGRFALQLGTPVQTIARDAAGVRIRTADGDQHFDHVVLATHANTALALLAKPTDDERRVLGAFRYSRNRTLLHTDRAFLPKREAAHAAWNYVADPDTSRVAVTYSMTKLQGLPNAPYLVTLNPRSEPRGVLHEAVFDHPQFDRAALRAQRELPALNGTHGTYYAGAYFGFGFHEDGMRSGLEAARALLTDAHTSRSIRATASAG
jgi:uncharacterized protein